MIYNLIDKRLGGEVKRFHTQPMLREHLVSSHSWGVAMCVQAIDPHCRKELIMAALEHDVHEHITGDVNSITLRLYPELKKVMMDIERKVNKKLGIHTELYANEFQILRTADLGDLVLCCLHEYEMGNKKALVIVAGGLSYLGDFCTMSNTRQFYNELENHVISSVGVEELDRVRR